MNIVTVNDVTLAAEDTGAGPPVVFVHGSWSDRHAWDLVTPALTDRYRVITYDRRGHSQSDRPSGPQGIEAHAADLASLIDHFEAAPAHIVTNSFGGVVALQVAVSHPDRVASLCLHEPPAFALVQTDPQLRTALEQARQLEQQVVDEIRAGNQERAARTFVELAIGPGAWERFPESVRRIMVHNAGTVPGDFDAEYHTPTPARLSTITAPVLLTGGGQSPPDVPFAAILDRLAAVLPAADRYTFQQAGHVPHRTHPEELGRVVADFITEHTHSHRHDTKDPLGA